MPAKKKIILKKKAKSKPSKPKEEKSIQKVLEKLAIEANVTLPENLEDLLTPYKDAQVRKGQPAHYYRFFYAYARKFKPMVMVELGTHLGVSSVCLADGNPEAQIFTVDVTHGMVMQACRRDKIYYLTQDSKTPMNAEVHIDLLFIDTEHNGKLAGEEFAVHFPKVVKGGVTFFDDIHINPGMEQWWNEFPCPEGSLKFELGVHGGVGFGVIVK